ncbi:arylsulfotransferase family protein [Falsirhodobacter sp. alg1]|uniref:arylsulfotransferase family protein n=1 Tax=Falsirhodobacter sp. alg1 TaxID=1472418 RepID=UPI0007892037|nr:arylsulfotransferase family protein [Falsirhodobacter sp. alg1]
MSEKLPMIAFTVSVAVMGTAYGVFAARNNWFPHPQITLAMDTLNDMKANWKNDVGLEPTRHLVPSRTPGEAARFIVKDPAKVTPGYTLIAGLSADQDIAPFTVTMYDEKGDQVHQWPINYEDADPDGPRSLNTMLHGMEVMPDGSILAAFDAGNTLARFDTCGIPIWATKGAFHHTISPDGPDGFLGWRDNTITHIDAATGEATPMLSIEDDLIKAGDGQEGIFGIRTFSAGGEAPLTYESDPFHANDVESLPEAYAAVFPQFEAGDLLISLRELNLVAVVGRTTGELKWYQHGPWLKQHDPDWQPDGTITVFDNHTGSQNSRILRVDPKTHKVDTLFAGSEEIPFYSWQRGKHQILPSGNILITEAQHGRVFEVTPAGELVWERDMGWDDDQNLIVTEARHVAPDFFTDGVPSCAVTASANHRMTPRG